MWRTVVVLVLTSFVAAIMGCAQRQPLEATLQWESEDFYVGVATLDSAGSPGLVRIENDYYVQLSNLRLQAVMSTPFVNRGTFRLGDMAGAVGGLVWATCKRNDSLFLVDVPKRREMFVASGVDREPPAGWDGYITDVFLRDINADGKLEAVVVVCSGSDADGRGIYVINWASGKLLWSFRTGPPPTNVLLRDVDGDGKTEILLGTMATGNGDSANSTDDFHTYALLLKSNGERDWIQPIGKHSSFVMVSWLADSSSLYPPILATEIGFPAGERTRDSVFVLDSRDGSVTARAQYGTYNTMQAVLNGKSGMAVLIAGADDTLRCLDPMTLKLRNRAAMPCGVSSPSTLGYNSIGAGLAVVPTTDGRLLVVSDSLRVECEVASGAAQGIRLVPGASVPTFIAEGLTGGREVHRLYSVEPTPVLRKNVSVVTMLAALMLALVIFGFVLATVRYRQTRDMRAVVRGLTGQAGVVEIGNRGHVRHTNPKARELLGGEVVPAGPLVQVVKAALAEPPGSMPKETLIALGSGKTVLARAARVRFGVMLTLEDISAVEYLQRVKAWAPVAQKLAHGIKNPLGTIMGAVEQIETKVEDDRVKKYVGYVKDEVTRLKKMTDAFMRFTKLDPPALEPQDVNELIRKVVAKYEGALAKGISLELSLDDRLPLVALDEEGIANVLDIVMENAVEAMSGEVGGRQNTVDRVLRIRTTTGPVGSRQDAVDRALRIRTACADGLSQKPDARCEKSEVQARTVPSLGNGPRSGLGVLGDLGGSHVRIEVEDTGMGIPQKYLGKVFEPYFTHGKPDGTGLGLALAKKIVEDHKGRMEIRSVEGVGTTVSIVLPAIQEHA